MRRSTILWLLVGLLAAAGVAAAYLYFAGGSGEPSTELTTPPVSRRQEVPEKWTFVLDAVSIDPSQRAFEIDEVLRGEPKSVLGTTSEIAGQFQFDPETSARSSSPRS